MATKIPFYIQGKQFYTNQLNGYRTYNPVLLNFYRYIDITNFDDELIKIELAKWGGKLNSSKEYILFGQDEDATLFLLKFS
jgi:hypothetical protein